MTIESIEAEVAAGRERLMAMSPEQRAAEIEWFWKEELPRQLAEIEDVIQRMKDELRAEFQKCQR